MKKLFSMLLVLCLLIGSTSVLADEKTEVHLFGFKVEIDPALQEYAKLYNEMHPDVNVTIESLGGGGDYGAMLKSKNQSGTLPQIIQIVGEADYNDWKDHIVTLDDMEFVKRTSLSYKDPEGHVVGFPVGVEGYGLAYNKDLLDKAGIDPATLNTRANIQAAFEKLDSMKDELGIDYVVSSAASTAGGMWWSMGQHVWSVYFSGGIEYGDTKYIDMAREGKVDEARIKDFAEYIALLYKYSDPQVLKSGNYNDQVAPFADQKCVFVCQGNWIDPNLKELKANFNMGFAPHAFQNIEDNGVQINPPNWYAVTNSGTDKQIAAAKAFIDSFVTTKEGEEFFVKKAGMIPAVDGVEIKPEGKLSLDLMDKIAKGGNHAWLIGEQPSGFDQNLIGPIMDLYADDPQNVDVDALAHDLTDAVAQMPSMLNK